MTQYIGCQTKPLERNEIRRRMIVSTRSVQIKKLQDLDIEGLHKMIKYRKAKDVSLDRKYEISNGNAHNSKRIDISKME